MILKNYNVLSITPLLILLVLGLVLNVLGNPRMKRDVSQHSETVIAHLEKLAAGFNIDRFDKDPVLIQKPNKANSITKYYLPAAKDDAVYERNSDDSDKEVIVLKGEEDKLTFKKFKRIYVIFRRRPGNDADKYYFATLAYLRAANEKDTKDLLEVEGVKQVVEWVTFDEHVVPDHSDLSWKILQCQSNFIVPCAFNNSALAPPENFVASPHYKAKEPSQVSIDEEMSKRLQIEGTTDPLDNYDLYGDLDSKKVQGRGFFDGLQEVGILGGLLSGVGAVACTIVSIIASCADESATGNMMMPGMAAAIAVAQNPVGSMLLGRRRKREEKQLPDLVKLLDYPGWKTQYFAPQKDITFKANKSPNAIFYGLGNCPYVESAPTDLKAATTNDEIVNFYLTKLRAQCITWMKEYLTNLISIGLLTVRDKNLEINQTHTFLGESKLTLKELLQLTAAVELDAFSNVYADESTNSLQPQKSKSPDGLRIISRSTNFIINVGLKAIERIGLFNRLHYIQSTRHMLQNYKQIFSKLSQDAQNLLRCPDDCSHDKEVNYNDRIQVWSIIEFIKYGLGSVVSSADAKNHFKEFYSKNAKSIETLVNIYS